jgi:multicomponent Na+:H+ antiporter subunit D
MGSMVYLLGVALLYASFDSLDIATLGSRVVPGTAASASLALVTIGLLLKTALFPLHFWLPRAHGNAPAPVSAILSGLVVKASFYMVLRLWFEVYPAAITPSAGQFVGVLGATAVVWGSIQAVRQHRLKLLVAYSTVSQIGYLFLLVPLVVVSEATSGGTGWWRFDAWSGGIYYGVSHAFAKASMFMAAGTMVHVLGHDRLEEAAGLAGRLPVTVFSFGLAGLTLVGLPPSGGFVGKWLMLGAAVASGQWWWVAVLLVGGLLSAAYVFLALGQMLGKIGEPVQGDLAGMPVRVNAGYRAGTRTMEAMTLALALLAIFLGLRAVEPLALLAVGSPIR